MALRGTSSCGIGKTAFTFFVEHGVAQSVFGNRHAYSIQKGISRCLRCLFAGRRSRGNAAIRLTSGMSKEAVGNCVRQRTDARLDQAQPSKQKLYFRWAAPFLFDDDQGFRCSAYPA
jgi:hypothetical protein